MLNFDPTLLGPYFSFADHQATLAPPNSVQIAQANAQRVALIVSNPLAGLALIRPFQAAAAGNGISLLQNTFIVIDFATWGQACGAEWFGFSGIGGNIYIMEVFYRPPAGSE